MVDLPDGLLASSAELAEARTLVGRIAGAADSVAAALAQDLADGIGGRPVVITASGTVGELAADHWRRLLIAAGFSMAADVAPGAARIHLHSERAAAGYSFDRIEDLDGADLVGEVVAQGASDAARYASLVAVATELVNLPAIHPPR